jgi:hypothetical protein
VVLRKEQGIAAVYEFACVAATARQALPAGLRGRGEKTYNPIHVAGGIQQIRYFAESREILSTTRNLCPWHSDAGRMAEIVRVSD